MKLSNNLQVFFSLIRAGLWEHEVKLGQFDDIDYDVVYRLAQEQSVVGLVAAGIEHVIDVAPPKEKVLIFVGDTLQLETRNKAMNYFIGMLIEKMKQSNIDALLVKGQGIAQCYERPLWRASGDVDLLLNPTNYEQCIKFLEDETGKCGEEDPFEKHWEILVGPWEVELHGRLLSMCLPRMDKVVDDVIQTVTTGRKCRIWNNDTVAVPLPAIDEDIVLVFSHILKHLFRGGVGLRQICDWCRLLWIYREEIDKELLSQRLKRMGVFSEWEVMSSFAVRYLNMPVDAMPFYSHSFILEHKAKLIFDFILESGNFGHNRDNSFYYTKPFLVQKIISLSRHTYDSIRFFFVFPLDSLSVWFWKFCNGLKVVLKNKE